MIDFAWVEFVLNDGRMMGGRQEIDKDGVIGLVLDSDIVEIKITFWDNNYDRI